MKKKFRILIVLITLLIFNPLKSQAANELNNQETIDLLLSRLVYELDNKNIDDAIKTLKTEIENNYYIEPSVVNNLLKNIKLEKVVKKSNGFKGAIFKEELSNNKSRYRVVFSGTDESIDWATNILQIILDLGRIQSKDAVSLFKDTLTYKDVSEIRVTGHSLGGFLTQYVGNQIYIRKTIGVNKNIKLNFTTFNAPGIYLNKEIGDAASGDNWEQYLENVTDITIKNLELTNINNYIIDGDKTGEFATHLGYEHIFESHKSHPTKYHSLYHFYKYGTWKKAYNFKTLEVDPIYHNSKTISGKTNVSQAFVTIYCGNNKIASGKTDSTGSFNIDISNKSIGAVVKVNLSKSEFNDYSLARNVLIGYTVNNINKNSTSITGNGLIGATVGAYVNGKQIGKSVKVGMNGTYKITIPKQKVGTKVVVKISHSGSVYKPTEKTITVYNTFDTFTVNSINNSSTSITGKGVSGATVGAYVNGKQIAKSTVGKNGTYKITIPKQKAGTKVIVKIAKSGYVTSDKTITVLNVFSGYTVNNININSTSITGKGVSGATVSAYVNGKQIGKNTTVGKNGTYKITIPKQKAGTKVTVKMAKSGYETIGKTVTVYNTFSTFKVNSITTSSTSITGKGVSGATVGAYVNGKQIGKNTTVGKDGTYKITIPKQKAGTKVLVGIIKSGYVASDKTITVLNVFSGYTVNNINTNSTSITGKGVSGATVSAYVNGKQIGKNTIVGKNGTYKITIPKQKRGTKVTVKISKSGYVTSEKNITVTK